MWFIFSRGEVKKMKKEIEKRILATKVMIQELYKEEKERKGKCSFEEWDLRQSWIKSLKWEVKFLQRIWSVIG